MRMSRHTMHECSHETTKTLHINFIIDSLASAKHTVQQCAQVHPFWPLRLHISQRPLLRRHFGFIYGHQLHVMRANLCVPHVPTGPSVRETWVPFLHDFHEEIREHIFQIALLRHLGVPLLEDSGFGTYTISLTFKSL